MRPVTLVGIANHVFKGCLLFGGQFPFHACGKSSAPRPRKTGTFDLIYYLFRSMVEKESAKAATRHPLRAIYSSMFSGSMKPQLRNVMHAFVSVEIHMFRIAYFLFGFRIGNSRRSIFYLL